MEPYPDGWETFTRGELFKLASNLADAGSLKEGETVARFLIQRDPDYEYGYTELARNLYFLQRDPERAEAFLAEATQRFSKNAYLFWARGVNLAWLPHRYAEALPHLQTALELEKSPENHSVVAWCCFALGRIEEGVVLAKAALRRGPAKEVALEAQFQLYLLGDAAERETRLHAIVMLLSRGAVVQDWDFGALIEQAIAARHAGQLHRLAKVIDGTAQPETLTDWDEWKAASLGPLPPPPAPTAEVSVFLGEVTRALAELAVIDPERTAFGSRGHDYALNARAREAEVEAFETKWGRRLPEDYRRFLIELGNGGAGPGYGLFPLGRAHSGHDIVAYDDWGFDLRAPFPHEVEWNDQDLLDDVTAGQTWIFFADYSGVSPSYTVYIDGEGTYTAAECKANDYEYFPGGGEAR
jgi:tetratricopeptide (TPR) repeat protein